MCTALGFLLLGQLKTTFDLGPEAYYLSSHEVYVGNETPMTHRSIPVREGLRADEGRVDGRSQRGWTPERRYEDITARDQSRRHIGDHYANINIYHEATTTASASRSSGPDPAKIALENLMFDEMDARYLTINASLAPRSCRWLFDRQEYRTWQDINLINEHHGFLWIKGKAGAGKSTLMKYAFDAAEDTRRAGQTVVSFFFNARGAPIERSLEGMYRALLYQIFDKLPQLRPLLKKKRTPSAQNKTWAVDGLRRMFQDVVESLDSERLTCYVDALDECTENDLQEMVSFFEELGEHSAESGTQFYVCFASRHYPYINIDQSVDLVLEAQDGHKEDISNYVQKKLKISDEFLKEEISKQIEGRASGIFLWVVLVVKILNDECKRGNVHLVRTRLKQIPTELTDLIQDILQRDQPTRHLVPLLQWVLYSRRPLAREELFLALQSISVEAIQESHVPEALTHDNIDKFILNTSKGLVEMTKGKHPRVQFIHELVRAHFFGPEGLVKLEPGLGTNLAGLSHNRLKQCCYNYLLSKTCARVPLPAKLPKADSDEGKTLRSQTTLALPFLQYTLDSIWYHANAAHAQDITQRDFINSFPLADWRRLNNVMARYTSHRHTNTVSKAYILAEQGCAALLEITMEFLPEADAPKERCRSLLGAAIDSRDVQSARAILKREGYEQSLGKGKRICLALAIQTDEFEIVQALLGAHAKPYNPKVEVTTNNALVLAASRPDKFSSSLGRFGLLRLICEGLTSADKDNDFCMMALEGALQEVCKIGDLEMFHWLCEKRARLTGEALRLACNDNHVELVRAILNAGASESSESTWTTARNDCLIKSIEWGHHTIVQLLLEHGADVDALGTYGMSALRCACLRRRKSIVALLVEHGAALNTKANSGSNLARFFSDHGNTALFIALSRNSDDIARFLIEKGADIHCVCSQGRNALWAACDRGNEAMVRLLVERGAAANMRDYHVRTALSVAKDRGHTEIVRLIMGESTS